MNLKILFLTACLWFIVRSASTADKWSRQLDETGPGTEAYDWIPVAQPVDAKERAGRVITYQQNFPPNAAFGEIQKPHHVSQQQQIQPFGFPFHFQRFPQPQTQIQHNQPQIHQQQPIQQHQKLGLQPQQPTSQSFFKFEMPFNRDGNRNQDSSQGVQTGYQIQHSSFGAPQSLFHSPLFTQKQVFPPEFHPVPRPQQSSLQQVSKPIQQNFIDEPLKQNFRDPIPTHSSISSTSAAPPAFNFQHNFELQKPASFQSQLPFQAPSSTASAPAPPGNTQQDQEVQLLYVPYDTLYNQQRAENPAFDNSKFNQQPNVQHVNPYQINDFYTPETLQPQDPNRFIASTTLRTTTTTLKPTTPFQNYFGQQFTTPKPKPKAHQPPLAMFLLKSSSRPTQSDVVNALRNAKTIAVLDAPTSQAPNVFVGPAGMQTPNGYAKFELPYLSQIAQNNNFGETSFFVAPLSYRTPAGFNKILLPEPHVGSIVVNRQRETYNDVRTTKQPTPQPETYKQYQNRPSSPPETENYPQPQFENYNNVRVANKPTSQQSEVYNNVRGYNQATQQPLRETYNNIRGSTQQPTQQPQRETYNNIRGSNPAQPNQNIFITPTQNEIQQFPSTTQRNRPDTTQRTKSTTMKEYYPEIVRDVPKLERGRYPYEATTQRQPTGPSRGHKFSEISTQSNYYPEAIQEVTSPKIYKQERIKQKRPENQYSDNARPYAHFKPIPNNIPPEDFYKVQPIRTSSPTTTTSTSTTTTTTSTTPPRTYFTQTYPTSPQIDFQSTHGQVYHNSDVGGDRFTTRPPSQQQDLQQVSDEEYRMKQYYRQQDAFRNRPSYPSKSTSRPTVESIPYTSVSVDYDREVRIPSSTPTYYTTTSTTPRPVTQRQRVTFYHPTTTPAYEDNVNTVPPSEQVFEFSRDRDVQTTPPQQEQKTQVPENHKLNFSNSNLNNNNNNNNEISTQDGSEVEFEPNPYQLPSELPPLTPNLPGLVNGLIDKERQNGADGETTVQMEATTKPTPSTRPTRRPINRVKKPVVSKVSQSVSYSSSDYSTRRPLNRTRRPYTARNYTSSSTSTTERSSTTRSPLIRNPNRIRYNPTPEERQSLRIKNRKNAAGGKKEDNSDDLEYQRDVLKQNYPVFKPANRRTTTTPVPNSTERPVSESQQVFTVTPSSEQNYDGLIEPMQIAQQYQEYPQTNYGPGYFPNEENTVPTEAVGRNEISPVYSSSSTTEEPQATTRRTPFIRRGPRIRTTTDSPTTTLAPTTSPSEERYTVRARAPPRRIVKVRARTRRPHPASSTSTSPPEESEDESQPQGNNVNRLNRFNQDLYQDEMSQRRQRIKSQFHLEPQESQWSPSLSGKSINNFQPLTEKDDKPSKKEYANEPEIVTASPDAGNSDSYVFNVSAGFGPTANTHFSSKISEEKTSNNSNKSEKSFADLLEEVMSDIGKDSDVKSTDPTYFESQKMNTNLSRKGKWKKGNASAAESFETAESQNIGTQFFNSLYTGKIEKSTTATFEESYATTSAKVEPLATTTSSPVVETELNFDTITTSPTPQDDNNMKYLEEAEEPVPTTSLENMPLDSEPESITHRIDDLSNVEDLDTQPSVFSEVRKQLNELFRGDENDPATDDEDDKDFVQPHKYEYTSIHRVRTTSDSNPPDASAAALTEIPQNGNANIFHKNLMKSVVYATSTSTKEEAPETEICYRGRCIRSEDLPSNHKLH
ncbi:mucin-2 [Eupeodes corollae]|uniref:mucin-2 n=1 Tax=Eupeodes corollae TaxID=290404 RepID=UPI002491219D|nr:mucin-2 [Eupeodes corollae]